MIPGTGIRPLHAQGGYSAGPICVTPEGGTEGRANRLLPGREELAFGALATGGVRVRDLRRLPRRGRGGHLCLGTRAVLCGRPWVRGLRADQRRRSPRPAHRVRALERWRRRPGEPEPQALVRSTGRTGPPGRSG